MYTKSKGGNNMEDKIINDPGNMVCSRYKLKGAMGHSYGDSCANCQFFKNSGNETICTNEKGNPKPIIYKDISDPDNMLCHKIKADMSKVKNKYGVNLIKLINWVSKKGQKGAVINEKEDPKPLIPVCSVCEYCNGKGCRLRMRPHRVTDKINGQTTVVYDIKGKLHL